MKGLNPMIIHQNFTGGNIVVKEQNGNDIYLENELRDTTENWFYWAFCIEGAEGQTLNFHFQKHRIGYYGPAVSHDLKEWHWLEEYEDESEVFTYTFKSDENKVYFAHSMLYHPERFYEFSKQKNLEVSELCKSLKGRSVPYLKLGNGSKSIILTARHHACESPGSYVLEGVLDSLIKNPIDDTTIFCVPFVDFDGVTDGDQGKSRAPHDHNRDYDPSKDSIYPECKKIREFADQNGCWFGFDFHAPWHKYELNDNIFIVQNNATKIDRFERFGSELEKCTNKNSMQYQKCNDIPPETGWNQPSTQFAVYMNQKSECDLAFTLENTYFGKPENKVSQEKLIELGRCFANAVRNYIANKK